MDARESELERRIGLALRGLRPLASPPTLLPRVMAAVAGARSAPWYSRGWLTWPRAAQAVSLLLLAATGATIWWAMPAVSAWADGLTASAAPLVARVSSAAAFAADALAVGRAIWSVVLQPVAIVLVAMAAAASLVAAACWSAINRLALGGALQ